MYIYDPLKPNLNARLRTRWTEFMDILLPRPVERTAILCVCILLSVASCFITLGFAFLYGNFPCKLEVSEGIDNRHDNLCSSNRCSLSLVESIPENLTFSTGNVDNMRTYSAWSSLLDGAQDSVDMAIFYWSLLSEDVKSGSDYPSASQGRDIFEKIKEIGKNSSVAVRVAQNAPTEFAPQHESKELQREKLAEVRDVDIAGLVGGVLHTKLMIVDDSAFYVGSANMDFRSLTQVKELGVTITNCPCLTKDIKKIFSEYWLVGGTKKIPSTWSESYSTIYNDQNPMRVMLNGVPSNVYISSSPPPFTSSGRVDDIDAIVKTIEAAQSTVDVAVMDYFPRSLYGHKNHFWPTIDSALRRAALDRGVRVRVMASHWTHTRPDLPNWLQSLQDVSSHYPHIDIQTKVFVVPTFTEEQRDIPFARVNHNKYMVTDDVAYIGTSNWSEDYFTNTAGIGLVVQEVKGPAGPARKSLRTQLQAVFDRDWNSQYAKPVAQFIKQEGGKMRQVKRGDAERYPPF